MREGIIWQKEGAATTVGGVPLTAVGEIGLRKKLRERPTVGGGDGCTGRSNCSECGEAYSCGPRCREISQPLETTVIDGL